MRKETRGRKPKKHTPIKKSFEKVLEVLADSEYKNEKLITKKKK